MAIRDIYRGQVALLVRLLPLIAEQTCFALKGGTAINLFIRDMPRLSVDIDLTYLPVQPRAASLAAIDAAMIAIVGRIQETIGGVLIQEGRTDGAIATLNVRAQGVQVKIEVTPVLRGCVFDPQVRSVSESVEQTFGFAEIAVVSEADLYGGKIVAALDRQHPRDLFDVRELMANVNAGEILQRLAGVKVQHGCKPECPRYRGHSGFSHFIPEGRRPAPGLTGLGVTGAWNERA